MVDANQKMESEMKQLLEIAPEDIPEDATSSCQHVGETSQGAYQTTEQTDSDNEARTRRA